MEEAGHQESVLSRIQIPDSKALWIDFRRLSSLIPSPVLAQKWL